MKGLGKTTRRLKNNPNFPNRTKVSDEVIREKIREGWFIGQILGHYKIGRRRLQLMMHEYENSSARPEAARG